VCITRLRRCAQNSGFGLRFGPRGRMRLCRTLRSFCLGWALGPWVGFC